jgi:DNA-binding transcriptional LysR family regulator
MELRQLRYFLTVVDEGQITRAATRLRISQAGLSQQIQRLERDLGAPLFVRTGSRITLTPSGQIVASQARQIVQMCDRLTRDVALTAQGSAGGLEIGYWPGTAAERVSAIAEGLRDRGGEVTVSFRSGEPVELVRDVSLHKLDAALVDRSAVSSDLEYVRVGSDELLLVVTAGHRLVSYPQPSLEWLCDESFVVVDRVHAPGLYDATIAACHAAGFAPRVIATATSLDDAALMVAAGRGVALLPKPHAQRWVLCGLTLISLAGQTSIETVVCWDPAAMNETLGEFIRLATSDGRAVLAGDRRHRSLESAAEWVATSMRLRLAIGAERVVSRCITETTDVGLGDAHLCTLFGNDRESTLTAIRHETDAAFRLALDHDPVLHEVGDWFVAALKEVRDGVDGGAGPTLADDRAMELDTFSIGRFIAAGARIGSLARVAGYRALEHYPAACAAYITTVQGLINEVEAVASAMFPTMQALREQSSSPLALGTDANTADLLQAFREALPVELVGQWDLLSDQRDVVAFDESRAATHATGTEQIALGLRAFGVRAEFGRQLADYPARVVSQLATSQP